MGTFIEINDTLQITSEQGFPTKLLYEEHIKNQFKAEDFAEIIFEFKDKPNIRIYRGLPVRNFLVENINGKWIYWGLVHILETKLDFVNNTTSGKYRIIYINTPEEMKIAHKLIDQNDAVNFFK